MIGIEEIKKILPHRYPFLLVDRVLEYEKDKWIKTIKNVTINEPFFVGHFPHQHVMPGVLVIEAMAQSGGILSFLSIDNNATNETRNVYFMQIDKAKFRKPIIPGDRLEMHIEILKRKLQVWKMEGKCFVDGQLAAEAIMMAKLD